MVGAGGSSSSALEIPINLATSFSTSSDNVIHDYRDGHEEAGGGGYPDGATSSNSSAVTHSSKLAARDINHDQAAAGDHDSARGHIILDSHSNHMMSSSTSHDSVVSEIIELREEDDNSTKASRPVPAGQLTAISETNTSTSLFSIDIDPNNALSSSEIRSDHHYVVYVAVGKGDTSTDALLWTLNHAINPTLVYLVHIFPELKFIPSPLGGGWVPKSQVSSELAESYLTEDRRNRRELLSKYMEMCTAQLVQVETILIESDLVANAIIELISVLNISKLVVGISKSNLRKLRGGKGTGITANQILQSAPAGCEIKVICQGEDVSEHDEFLRGRDLQDPTSPLTPTTKSKSPAAPIIRRGTIPQNDELRPSSPNPGNSSFSCCFRHNFS